MFGRETPDATAPLAAARILTPAAQPRLHNFFMSGCHHPLMKTHRLLILVTFFVSTQLFAQTPAMRARIDGLIGAFNSTPEEFEKYAVEAYTPEFLSTTTAEQRKAFLQRAQGEFGKLEIIELRREGPDRVGIGVSGAKGPRATIRFEHELEPPHRITNLAIVVGEDDPAQALPPVPVSGSMSNDELSSALDGYLARLSSEDRFSGVVLIARDGKPVFEKAYGLANRSDNVPNTPATRFNLGSINKHFTRTAIAQLAAAGKLSPTDTIAKHLPDYPNAKAHDVTVQQLLDMTAGLADFFSPEFEAMSKDRFRRNRDYYRFVAPKPLNFEPGSRRQYCNSCFIVLGEIVERVAKMPYEQYVTENVFRRAGMQGAAFLQSDDIAPNVAIGYTRRMGDTLRSNVVRRGAGSSAAGSAYATARDLLAMDEAVRRATLLDAQTVATFFNLGEPVNGRRAKPSSYAGGSEGVNAAVAAGATWTVITLANFDPPAAEALAQAIYSRLTGAK